MGHGDGVYDSYQSEVGLRVLFSYRFELNLKPVKSIKTAFTSF